MNRNIARFLNTSAAGAMASAALIYVQAQTTTAQTAPPATFGQVVSFVDQHSKLTVLQNRQTGAAIAVWPAMQGRVLTSSANGIDGQGFGWYNHDLIASGEVQKHMNAVGGEDRIWMGPEGGQFSIFFAPGAAFDLDHWYTPAAFDSEPFDVVGQTSASIALKKVIHLTNYSGTVFDVRIDREVRLLTSDEVWKDLKLPAAGSVKVVGYESINKLTNIGSKAWAKDTGLLSLWDLGQFQANARSTILLPIRPGPEAELGVPVTTDYFGTVPPSRLDIRPDSVFFRADANFRSKLGLNPRRARGLLGSYDALHHVLTVVQYNQPASATDYVNSAWKIQTDPFHGDVANCYNDGPPVPGKPQMGQFYELESSSPAAALAPRHSIEHIHRTIHLVGSEEQLRTIAKAVLGVDLNDVESFNP